MLTSMSLTEREQEIVALLRRDPLIGSAALAEALGTTRAAVNVHLSNLGKKGVILGRGYVLSEQPAVVVVGGANMDVKARSAAARGARHQQPRQRLDGARRRRPQHRREPRPARHPHPPGRRGRRATRSATRCSPRPPAAGVHVEHVRRTAGAHRHLHRRARRRRRAGRRRSPTWPPPTSCRPETSAAARDLIAGAGLVVLDGNLAPATLALALDLAAAAGVRVVLEPVSVPKAERPRRPRRAPTGRCSRSRPTGTSSPRSPGCPPAPTGSWRAPWTRCTPAASSTSGSGSGEPARC